MDLARSLEVLAEFFQKNHWPFAVCGGIALGIYGFPTPTFDVDVVTVSEAQEPLVAFLSAEGFTTLHRSAAFSNHGNPDLGRVDVVYIRGRTAQELFASVKAYPGPGGLVVPTAAPEHLVAMKLAAVRDDPSRLPGNLPALAFLVRLPQADRKLLQDYFQRFGFRGFGVTLPRPELFSPEDLPVTRQDREALLRLRQFSPAEIFAGWKALAAAFPHLVALAARRRTFANSRPFSLAEDEQEEHERTNFPPEGA